MMKNNSNLNVIYVFLGALFFAYLFYFRVIYVRTPRDLYNNISDILLYVYILIVLGHIIALCTSLYKIWFYNPQKKSKWLEKFMKHDRIVSLLSFFQVYSKSMKEFDTYIKSFAIIDKYYTDFMYKLDYFIAKKLKFYYVAYLTWIFNFCIL